jgi:hypothetical protein
MPPSSLRASLSVVLWLALAFQVPLVSQAPGTRLHGAVRERVLTADALRRDLASQVSTVALTTHGKTERYDAVPLIAVLEHAGLLKGTGRNAEIALAVVARAADGYAVVFGLGELLPNTGARDVFVAFAVEGQRPLPADQAPLRLVVPSDRRGARSAFAITEIEVRDLTRPGTDTAPR